MTDCTKSPFNLTPFYKGQKGDTGASTEEAIAAAAAAQQSAQAAQALVDGFKAGNGSAGIGFQQDGSSRIYPLYTRLKLTKYAEDYVQVTDVSDSEAIQRGIDYLYANGGGRLILTRPTYNLKASKRTDVFSNWGVPVAANTACLILWPGVTLEAEHVDACELICTDPTLTIMYMITPLGQSVRNLTITGGYNPANPNLGAGHCIFTLATAGMAAFRTEDVHFSHIRARNHSSYVIGLQNGFPQGCSIEHVISEDNGADCLDLKARDIVTPSQSCSGNKASHILVRRHGTRVTGSCAIDVRGIWHLSDVTVEQAAAGTGLDCVGVRFRTMTTEAGNYSGIGHRGTLTGFDIQFDPAAPNIDNQGVVIGSVDVKVSNGTVVNGGKGLVVTGNATGVPDGSQVEGMTVIGAKDSAFYLGASTKNTTLLACNSRGSNIGLNNLADGTMVTNFRSIGDTTPKATSSGAVKSEQLLACDFGANWGVTQQGSSTRFTTTAVGVNGADCDYMVQPGGNGAFRIGNAALTPNTGLTVAGYVNLKIGDGTTKRFMIAN